MHLCAVSPHSSYQVLAPAYYCLQRGFLLTTLDIAFNLFFYNFFFVNFLLLLTLSFVTPFLSTFLIYMFTVIYLHSFLVTRQWNMKFLRIVLTFLMKHNSYSFLKFLEQTVILISLNQFLIALFVCFYFSNCFSKLTKCQSDIFWSVFRIKYLFFKPK